MSIESDENLWRMIEQQKTKISHALADHAEEALLSCLEKRSRRKEMESEEDLIQNIIHKAKLHPKYDKLYVSPLRIYYMEDYARESDLIEIYWLVDLKAMEAKFTGKTLRDALMQAARWLDEE